jgi:hypothetical protein
MAVNYVYSDTVGNFPCYKCKRSQIVKDIVTHKIVKAAS